MLLCGIDEAGYGPLLGPLCVASATLEIATADAPAAARDWRDPSAAISRLPDLWKLLRPAVQPSIAAWRRAKQRGLVIADSKAAKLPNQSATLDPLIHLERAVLAFLSVIDRPPADDAALFHALGVRERLPEWYALETPFESLPAASTTADQLTLLAGKLAAKCDNAGVTPRELRVVALDEQRFNQRFAALGSKAKVSFEVVAGLIDRVRCSKAAHAAASEGSAPPLVVVDRQGGRRHYAGELSVAFGGATVTTLCETEAAAAYRVAPHGRGGVIDLVVLTGAESHSLPVALASMSAKLVRERLMRRFNAFWGGRFPEVRPTAGYNTDGWRWVREAEAAGFPEVRQLCRLA